MKRLVAILTACLLLAGCGAAPAPSGGSDAAPAESETAQVTLPTASGGLKALGQGTAFGSGNSSGYYYLSTLDGGASLLRYIDYATGEETTLSTDLFSGRSLDFVILASVTGAGYVVQAHEDRTAYNFLIDQTGKTTRQELFADSTDPRDTMRMLNVFAQPGGDYLVALSRSYRTVKVPGSGGISYGIDEPVHAFALISEADFWASKPNYRPVTRLE